MYEARELDVAIFNQHQQSIFIEPLFEKGWQ